MRDCPHCKMPRKVVRVEVIENGKKVTLECGHSFRDLAVVINETLKTSDSVSVMIMKEPVEEIRKAIQDHDYFKAVTYGCTIFEHFGKLVLISHFRKIERPIGKDRIKYMTLEAVIIMLYTAKLIDDPIYNAILRVKDVRNDFIHEDASIKFTPEQQEVARKSSDHALVCVKFIKALHESMVK